jgi:hypothetical protein
MAAPSTAMPRLVPDLRELEHVPEVARATLYRAAWRVAMASPITWLNGAMIAAILLSIAANQGAALFGMPGAILGAVLAASAASWIICRLLLPWRARIILPFLVEQFERELDSARVADQEFTRVIAACRLRERGERDGRTGR